MVIVLLVITLDIKVYIAELMEEMVKQEMFMWPQTILNVTISTSMDRYPMIVEE
jgi:hypothetical protein